MLALRDSLREAATVEDRWVSALLAPSLSWKPSARSATTKYPRRRFANEALAWQLVSQPGAWAGFRSVADRRAGSRATWEDSNRVVEIHKMMGAIGEQAGLCWTIEQDAQRFDACRGKISEEHHTLVLRALSESAGHFLLGAAHSLGNLGLRLALLDVQAAQVVRTARKKADFSPGTDDRRAWLPLNDSSEILAKAAAGSGNTPLTRVATAVSGLAKDQRYIALNSRRGMDFHRVRPQSVPHASPKGSIWRAGNGVVTFELPDAVLDPEADAAKVYRILVNAMEGVRCAMRGVRDDLPKAVRRAGIWYHEPVARPKAARAAKRAE